MRKAVDLAGELVQLREMRSSWRGSGLNLPSPFL
jgi:hypothetical protein